MYSKKILISLLSLLLLSSTFAVSAKSPSTTSYQPNQGYQASNAISHAIPIDIVFVGYNQEAINMTVLDDTILKHYSAPPMPYVGWTLEYEFSPNYVFANQTYQQALALYVLQNSVIGMNTTSKLNVTALEIQRATGTKMSIFLPQSGRAIDALAVDDWFATHPYVSSGSSRYTFYVLNFTNLDSTDHTLEHWYNLTETEYDANTTRDFWRLEWDNALNQHVGFPYAAFTCRHRLFFIDASAFNWYLTWARIWWEITPYLTDPKYDYYFEDLDTFQRTHDLSTPDGKTALGYYLGGWLDDIISNSIAPSAWAMPTYSLSLQVLVLNNASQEGYPTDKVKWILNSSLVEEAVKQLAPWMPIDVSVKFANLSDYPDVDSILHSSIINVQDGWTYIDGYNLFYGLESLREQHFNYNRAEMIVNAYVFLLKNASMIYGTNEFTGLGGDRQVLVLKSIDRYFRADGVTPKSGLSMVMAHELGHNIAFGHTFANFGLYYAGDFASDVMGYYPYSFYFTKLKIDLYRESCTDITLAKLLDALAVDHELYDGQNSSVLIDALFSEIENRINDASLLFDKQEYLDAVYTLFEAQRIEAYLRELLGNIIHFGDITHDGIVNITDAARIGVAWQSLSNDPHYDFFADLNHNGIINIGDVAVIVTNWQKTGGVTAGFFRWATGNRTTAFDYIADVYADWTTVEKNVTYGYWNWDSTALQCSLRMKNISDPDNFVYFDIKIYNQTSTILELTWNSGDPLPQNWASFTVAPRSKYFVQVEFTGSSNPPAWWSRVTIETKVDSP